MSWKDLLRYAMAGISQHKLRATLTLMGVILGSMLLFTSLSGGLGVINAVNDRLEIGNRLLEISVMTGLRVDEVTQQAARDAGFTEEMTGERRMRLAKAAGVGGVTKVNVTLDSIDRLQAIDHVAQAWALLRFGASIQLDADAAQSDRWVNVSVETAPPSGSPFGPLIVAGTNIGESDPSNARSDAIVSEYFLYQQGIRTDQQLRDVIGTKLRIMSANKSGGTQIQLSDTGAKNRTMTIVGVFRHPTKAEMRNAPDFVAAFTRQVLIPYGFAVEHWKRIGNRERPITARVLADHPENVAGVEKAISTIGFRTVSLSELALQIRTAVLLITGIITAIAGGALLISAIGIANTMVMNVMQRRKDIAIMKSIGAKDGDIQRMFLAEGMLLGAIGGLIGLALGLTLTHLSGDHITVLLEKQLNKPFIGDIFAYPLWLIVITPVAATIVTTLATLLPARRAAKIDPAKTLRSL